GRVIGGRRLHLEVALHAAHAQPVLAKGLQMGPARDEVHLRSGPGEPPAEIPADAARPVNSYTHAPPPLPCNRSLGWYGPQEAAFEHDRHVQLAVAVLVEQHRDLVAVVTLHRALAPALADDPRAHGERDLGPRGLGVREIVVAVSAGAGIVLTEV